MPDAEAETSAARVGQVLGWLALYLALTASISVAVYAVEFYLLS